MKQEISVYEPIPFQDMLFPIKIITGMRVFPENIRALPLRWHEQLEVLYFTRGGAVVECAGRLLHANDGDVILINPCELHGIHYGSGDPLYDCVMIDPELYSGAKCDVCRMRYITPMQEQQIFLDNIVTDSRACECIRELISEYNAKAPAYELAVKGDVMLFLALLFRSSVSDICSAGDSRRVIQRYERLEPAMRHISEHYGETLHLRGLAGLCNMEVSHFCRSFKAASGKTVMEYLGDYRLQKASVLLRTSDMSITDIAIAVGFSDNSYFSRRFKKLFGCTPKEARFGAASSDEN